MTGAARAPARALAAPATRMEARAVTSRTVTRAARAPGVVQHHLRRSEMASCLAHTPCPVQGAPRPCMEPSCSGS
eukprot:555007-Alexandrium_andersonii.AAC.1